MAKLTYYEAINVSARFVIASITIRAFYEFNDLEGIVLGFSLIAVFILLMFWSFKPLYSQEKVK